MIVFPTAAIRSRLEGAESGAEALLWEERISGIVDDLPSDTFKLKDMLLNSGGGN